MGDVKELTRPILVAYMPDKLNRDWEEVRRYILECLKMGVLVLDKSISLEVLRLPELGGVAVRGDRGGLIWGLNPAGEPEPVPKTDTMKKPEPVPEADTGNEMQPTPFRAHDGPDIKYSGKAGAEKRRIRDRMTRFRAEKGLGCWTALAKAIRGQHVTEEDLRSIHLGQCSPPIQDWRAIDKALDKLGFERMNEGAADG